MVLALSSSDTEVFVQAEEQFAMFDRLMHLAQNRRLILLREMSARKYRQTLPERIQRLRLTLNSPRRG